jgi:hypothetical protein
MKHDDSKEHQVTASWGYAKTELEAYSAMIAILKVQPGASKGKRASDVYSDPIAEMQAKKQKGGAPGSGSEQ